MRKVHKIIVGILLSATVLGLSVAPVLATGTTSATDTKTTKEYEPTFVVDADDDSEEAAIWFGKNYMLFGNNLKTKGVVPGLMLMAGNAIESKSTAEYGFFAGNSLNIAGSIEKDLFVAGNAIVIDAKAEIGRDVYIAGSDVVVKTDINGDLSVTAETVKLEGITIAGNLNITADEITVVGDVEVAGRVTHNDDAVIVGMNNLSYGSLETFHLEEVDDGALSMAAWYAKVVSMIGLFVVMAIICLISPRTHDKVASCENGGKFALNLVIGLGILIIVPIVAIMLFATVVAMPLALVALVVWGLMIYLSQGFAGAWLGHIVIEKLFKSKANIYVEAALGIVILGILSMIPTIGGLTGFLGLLFGMGLMVSTFRGSKNTNETKYYVNETVEEPKKSSSKTSSSATKSSAKTKKTSSAKTTTKSTKAKASKTTKKK